MPNNVRYDQAVVRELHATTASLKKLKLGNKDILAILDEKLNQLDKKLASMDRGSKNDDIDFDALIEKKLKEMAPLFKGEKGDTVVGPQGPRGPPGVSKQGARGLRGPNKLADLTDVDTSVPLEDGCAMVWNSEKRKFVPTQVFENE